MTAGEGGSREKVFRIRDATARTLLRPEASRCLWRSPEFIDIRSLPELRGGATL